MDQMDGCFAFVLSLLPEEGSQIQGTGVFKVTLAMKNFVDFAAHGREQLVFVHQFFILWLLLLQFNIFLEINSWFE